MSRSSRSRDTEVGQILETFLDNFGHEEFAEGYDTVYDSFEDVAKEVDEAVLSLEKERDDANDEIERLKEEIAELEGGSY